MIGISIGNFIGIGNSGVAPWSQQSKALFSRMTTLGETPVLARKKNIDATINEFIAEDLFDNRFDGLWLLRNKGTASTLLNWIKDRHNAISTDVYAEDAGLTGDGIAKYISLEYTPSTDAIKASQDNISFGIKISGTLTANDRIGVIDNVGYNKGLKFQVSTDAVNVNVNGGNAFAIGSTAGYGCLARNTAILARQYYANGVEYSVANNSVGLPPHKLTLSAYNVGGTVQYFGTETFEFAWVGAYITLAEFVKMQTIFNSYVNRMFIKQVYLMGDSLTSTPNSTYPADLLSLLGSGYFIVNKGVSGEETEDMLTRFRTDVIVNNYYEKQKYIVILAGTNDSGYRTTALIKSNLQAMYDIAKVSGMKVVAVTIPPKASSTGGGALDPAVQKANIEEVNTWILNNALNIDYRIDAHLLLEDPNNLGSLLATYDSGDHVHLSAGGYTALANEIYGNVVW